MEDTVKRCLREHVRRYPKLQVTDAVKLLYQSEFGGGHMIANPERSLRWIVEEWESQGQTGTEENERRSQKAADIEVVETIGNGMCRVYLSALNQGLYPETLNQMFVQTADRTVGTVEGFKQKLEALKECCRQGELPFTREELDAYLEDYQEKGCPPVSHSRQYRQYYHPAYRVAAEYYTRFYPVLLQIDRVRRKAAGKTVIVVIDGMCGSGKSTLGRILKELYGCNLFHMDDFFLRPWQRTEERLSEPGGNVDYERFRGEILDHICDAGGLEYRPYDCSSGNLSAPVKVPYCALNIIEGAYSHHPYFGDRYDLKFFYEVEPEEQLRRIMKRNGPDMLRRFEEEWIPMEQRYFEAFQIAEKSIVLR